MIHTSERESGPLWEREEEFRGKASQKRFEFCEMKSCIAWARKGGFQMQAKVCSHGTDDVLLLESEAGLHGRSPWRLERRKGQTTKYQESLPTTVASL